MTVWFSKEITGVENLGRYTVESSPVRMGGCLLPYFLIKWEYNHEAIERDQRTLMKAELAKVKDDISVDFVSADFSILLESREPHQYGKTGKTPKEKVGVRIEGPFRRRIPVFRAIPQVSVVGRLVPQHSECMLEVGAKTLRRAGYSAAYVYAKPVTRSSANETDGEKKPRTIYDEMREEAMNSIGFGCEPDWEAYDRACKLEEERLDKENWPFP
jgi:predicted transcriptional regulator